MEDVDANEAVEEVMTAIERHKAAGPDVPPTVSIDFYEGIAERCVEWAQTIRRESGEG